MNVIKGAIEGAITIKILKVFAKSNELVFQFN